MFIHSTILKIESPEMLEEAKAFLEDIGYLLGHDISIDRNYIVCNQIDYHIHYSLPCTDYFFTDNFELWKAITAIRDDSDYMQWFILGRDIFQGKKLCSKGDWYLNKESVFCFHYADPSKATKDELIKHFSK